MAWKAGKRDIWAEDGSRVAEIHCQEWQKVTQLISAAPELCRALEDMLIAFDTARDNSVPVRMANARRCANARIALAKAGVEQKR